MQAHTMSADMNSKRRFIILRLALSGLLVFNHIVGASFAIWSFAILAASVFSPSSAQAAIPQIINFQGRLSDQGGNPRNGAFDMTFRICDSPGGNCAAAPGQLWTETHTGASQVSVVNGIFSVQLGAVTPIPS
jgi:hypothetical protein